MTPLILQAFEGTNTQVPVWFMRQAGRYLPEYRELKNKYSLDELFKNPELAAKITCMPIDILGVDAAILFADILTLPSFMGFDISFDDKKGPIVSKKEVFMKDNGIHDIEAISHIQEAIKITIENLPKDVPLIGFAGSPFTVLSYLVEGGGSLTFSKYFQFIAEKPVRYHELMACLTKNTIKYLNIQKEAGIRVFQLFDSWAGIMRPSDYAALNLPYVQEIFKAVDLPSIYYVKNCAHLLPLMDKTKADFLSMCHSVVLGHNHIIDKTRKGVQGNLFNGALFLDDELLKKEVKDVLVGAKKHKKFIFNLSHGVLPNTPVDKLKRVVDYVHQYPWEK